MTSAEPLVERLYSLHELTELRRNTLRYARSFPPGTKMLRKLFAVLDGYQRAFELISGQASNGPFGSPVFACAGKTDPPSSSHPLADLGG
jgi:hypothetical protein